MTDTLITVPAVDLSDFCIVLRGGGFEANGLHRKRGEVLSATGWPYGRVASMLNSRVMGAAPFDLMDTMVECECGRNWITAEMRDTSHDDCPAKVAREAAERKQAVKELRARAAKAPTPETGGDTTTTDATDTPDAETEES